ncbi:MAG: hypothetical protein GY822_01225 [Deltaproteobacteria bacterium]|nr:hypothetical protein [Deltaproteobacteria bacterium]
MRWSLIDDDTLPEAKEARRIRPEEIIAGGGGDAGDRVWMPSKGTQSVRARNTVRYAGLSQGSS